MIEFADRERWKPVVGYEEYYEVSDHGRVKRIGSTGGAVVGQILQPYVTPKGGYLEVGLYDGHNNKINKKIHRLVARAFIGPPLIDKTEIRHLDGNPINNYVDNLKWGNNFENKADMVRHGRTSKPLNPSKGNDHHNCKIDDKEIPRILQLLGVMKQIEIAKKFNVSQATISTIKNGKIRRSNRTQIELDYYQQLKTHYVRKSGECHPMHKLTTNDVRDILNLLKIKTQKEIAQQFGVSQSTISAIKCGKLWRNING